MKKTTWLVIITLVVALALFIAGVILGGFSEIGTVFHQKDFNISLPFIRSENLKEEFNNIENLEIEALAGSFEIIEYNSNSIEVVAKNVSNKTELYQNNNTLVFKENLGFGNLPINKTKVQIFVPKDYQFNKVNIDIDAAKFIVPNLLVKELEIDVDAGSFEGDKIIATKTTIDVDAGDARVNLLDSSKSEFDVDAGNIEAIMIGSESDYSYEAECDLGNLEIGSYYGQGLSDEYSYRGGNRYIEANCNVGSIIVKMEVE